MQAPGRAYISAVGRYYDITITGTWGTDVVASSRQFELKRSRPGSQKLFFRGIASGGM